VIYFRQSLHGGRVEREGPGDPMTNLGRFQLRTKLGNPVENKGFSTALILRQRSTIRFGHASAARDL
jgi:hypothetical protein